MPELPEVETIVRDLAPLVEGRTITGATIYWPGLLGDVPVESFVDAIKGHTIQRLTRRAKYVLAYLSSDMAISIHLKMTGRLFLRETGDEEDRFTRAVLHLDKGLELRFADSRKFGRFRLLDHAAIQDLLARLGPEPLADDFTPEHFAALLDNRTTRIKALLLDQRMIAGIGNIYADESLFVAGIHPARRAKDLSSDEMARLYEAIRFVLRTSIVNRGTTFSMYRDAFGATGGHQRALQVYQRHGEPCVKCGTPIERLEVAQRGTHICPRCQPLKGADLPPRRTSKSRRTRVSSPDISSGESHG